MTENTPDNKPSLSKMSAAQIANASGELYAYQRVYPRSVKGFFRNIKNAFFWVLATIYFVGPWLRWDRGEGAPDQAIFIDLPGRKAYFFFIEIWPQEVYFLTGILVIAAITLFAMTAIGGRIWCGYACFQTVFTDMFIWVEKIVEGDRNRRIRLDKGKWTGNKIWLKTVKNLIWLFLSFLVGANFALYFHDAPQATLDFITMLFMPGALAIDMWSAQNVSWVRDIATYQPVEIGVAAWGTVAVVGGGCFIMAGYSREQTCIYMCPYSRFQGAMMDEETMIITYEKWRGEPRGKAKKSANFDERGHCVDCNACVQVCPTGIDIRDGSQLACIGCGLCADACNEVMDRFKLPRHLIRYDSVVGQKARAEGKEPHVHILRPRTYIYAAVLTIVCSLMLFQLFTRDRMEVNVLHERSPLFVTLKDGSIRNGYTFKILNMLPEDADFEVELIGLEGSKFSVVGYGESEDSKMILPVKGDSVGSFRLYVTGPRLDDRAFYFDFKATNLNTGEIAEQESLFAGPDPR